MQTLPATKDLIDVNDFKKSITEFVHARNWEQFQNPKNIAMALTVEAAELLEIFQWLTAEQAANIKNDASTKEKISHELADIMIYIIRLATQTEINLQTAISKKMQLNAQKYPAALVQGSIKKYSEHQ